ncbi:uncharacterized protein BJX67DRAFT_341398 [Aspergillus lucknowensis]|uniref:Uncharacterized protein n=1 Tax=Aspergillus lucknowensis TaxID=176173 RepID=A0ABR4M649_9EURO
MRFWKGWALWQKLSVILAFLLGLVLIYSFGVLAYNRRKMRKRAAEEANLRVEEEVQTGESDIPFGARALEKGIEVEGIWTMKRESLVRQPSVTDKGRISGLGALLRHKSTASSVQTPQVMEPESRSTSDTVESSTEPVLESVHIDTFRSSHPPKLDLGAIGHGIQRSSDNERRLSRGWLASRSSWMKPVVGYKRTPGRDGRRRTSSEDFRRRFSRLFDETLPPGPPRPTEMFQLTPIYQGSTESFGRASSDRFGPVTTK